MVTPISEVFMLCLRLINSPYSKRIEKQIVEIQEKSERKRTEVCCCDIVETLDVLILCAQIMQLQSGGQQQVQGGGQMQTVA